MDNTSWSRGNTALICRVPLALNPVNLNGWNIFLCSCLTLREDNDDNDDGGEDADNHMRSVDSLCNVLMYEPKVTCTTSFYSPWNPLRHIFWFYRWENWGLQRLSNLPKVIQLVKQRSQDLNTAMFEFKFVFLISPFCWSIQARVSDCHRGDKDRKRKAPGRCVSFLPLPAFQSLSHFFLPEPNRGPAGKEKYLQFQLQHHRPEYERMDLEPTV